MKLKVGDKAPEFSTLDIFGRPVEQAALRGRCVLLSFHRFSSCPFCNFRVHQLRTRFAGYDAKGLSVVTVFESSEQSLREGVAKQNVPFPIISNADLSLYRAYGVEKSLVGVVTTMIKATAIMHEAKRLGLVQPVARDGDITRMPADFLINREGRIHAAHYGKHMGDHLELDVIDAFLSHSPTADGRV